MTFNRVDGRHGQPERTRIGAGVGGLLFAVATVASLVFAALSMLLAALFVRLAASDQPDQLKVAIVAIGGIVGACLGGWTAQPGLTRVVSRVIDARAERGHVR